MFALDTAVFRMINGLAGNPILDAFFLFLTIMGNGGTIWILFALVLILGAGKLPGLRQRRYWRWRTVGLAMLVSLALAGVLDAGLKDAVRRIRPAYAVQGAHVVGNPPTSFSFPSGHTLTSFAAATLLFVALRWFDRQGQPLADSAEGWSALFLAAAIGFSRIYLGSHYPLDVLGGMLLGILVGWGVWRVTQRITGSTRVGKKV